MSKEKERPEPKHWRLFLSSLVIVPGLFFVLTKTVWSMPESEVDLQVITWVAFSVVGASLSRRHENNWSFSLFVLISILFGSAVQALRAPPSGPYVALLVLQAACALAACAYVKAYFKYPYVDRRKSIFSKAQRKNVDLGVELFAHIQVPGMIDNLSLTGARILFDAEFGASLKNVLFVDMKIPDLSGIRLKCRVMGVEPKALRVKFLELSDWERQLIDGHLKKLAQAQAQTSTQPQPKAG